MIEISCLPLSALEISPQIEEKNALHPQWVRNEIFRGKILKTFSSTNVLLLIKGKQVMAKTHVPLKEGAILYFKVTKGFPNPILKPLSTKYNPFDAVNVSKILSGMKQNLWKTIFDNIDGYDLSDKDKIQFKRLIAESSERLFLKPSPDLLKTVIDKSGLTWEAKLRKIFLHKTTGEYSINNLVSDDLKGLVSKCLALMNGKDDLLNNFLSTIKNIQLLNHTGLEQEGKIFVPIPIPFPDGLFTVGQLLIHFRQKHGDDPQGKETDTDVFRVNFLLEMSNLGPLRADLSIRGNEISGRFLLTEVKTKLFIDQFLPSFINRLKDKGYSVPYMECQIKEAAVVKASLVREITTEDGCNISLVA